MTISTAAKVGSGAVFAAGTPASIYFSWDHINYYEVERKVINGEVDFVVEDKTTSGDTNSWKIKVKTETSGEWNESSGYYWECVVSGKTTLSIDKTDLETRLVKSSGNTYEIRKNLVKACAENRTTQESKKVTSTFKFPESVDLNNWFEYIFGKDNLNETEKKVLEDSVYFSISEKTDTTPLTVIAAASSSDTNWTSGGYSWTCTIPASSTSISKTELDKKIPTSENNSETTKKANKKKLVYACSKDRQIDGKSVVAKLSFPEDITTNNWETYLFGSSTTTA